MRSYSILRNGRLFTDTECLKSTDLENVQPWQLAEFQKELRFHMQRHDVKPVTAESTRGSRLFILGIFLVFRWVNANLTRTYDNPDEFWQATEVAHRLVFGSGYLTWEWIHRIRSYFHPLIFAALYKGLHWCHWDTPTLVVNAPKYLQASLSAFSDVATYSLAKKVYGNHLAPYILFVILGSWFHFLMAARTLSNTLETVFTVMAMQDWPFPGMIRLESDQGLSAYRKSLFWASLACITRPTNALIWIFLGLQSLYYAPSYQQKKTLLINAGLIVSMMLALNVILDTYMYTGHLPLIHQAWANDLVFVPWTFIYTNIVQSIALFYGTHPFHWYIFQGLPLMLFTFIPLTLYGLYQHSATTTTSTTTRALVQLVGWVVVVYSLLSHKEFRFLYPIFPLLMIFTAHGLDLLWQRLALLKWILVAGLFVSQMALALYVSLWHQRGVMDAMTWLSTQPRSVGFLMPCHSTPWLSSLHDSPTMDPLWFLTCEPPLNSNIDNYLDQADRFYANPPAFLASLSPWPNTLVMFDNLLLTPGIKPLLKDYVECKRFFNSHVHWDSRRKGDVVILCRNNSI